MVTSVGGGFKHPNFTSGSFGVPSLGLEQEKSFLPRTHGRKWGKELLSCICSPRQGSTPTPPAVLMSPGCRGMAAAEASYPLAPLTRALEVCYPHEWCLPPSVRLPLPQIGPHTLPLSSDLHCNCGTQKTIHPPLHQTQNHSCENHHRTFTSVCCL